LFVDLKKPKLHQIKKATIKDAQLLSKISRESFLTAHGHSAPKEDIKTYISKNFTKESFIKELENIKNKYFLIYHNNKIAGYSKIVLNSKNENISDRNVTLMSRLYLLEEFYELSLGKELFNFNVELSKQNNQKGIWLAVWTENKKAINFYQKIGFIKIGKFDFKISETHSNPNHILFLEYGI
jgi:ribosomal protein S18 acetylase RimI-like enzyme